MKIKTKLAISFCIIIFVPVVLTSIVLVGFNKIQLKYKQDIWHGGCGHARAH